MLLAAVHTSSSSPQTRRYLCVASLSIPQSYIFTTIASRKRSKWTKFIHHQDENIRAQAKVLTRIQKKKITVTMTVSFKMKACQQIFMNQNNEIN